MDVKLNDGKTTPLLHGAEEVGQSTQAITAQYLSRGSSKLSFQGQSILRNQGGVMDHDHVLRIPFDGPMVSRPVAIPRMIDLAVYLTTAGRNMALTWTSGMTL